MELALRFQETVVRAASFYNGRRSPLSVNALTTATFASVGTIPVAPTIGSLMGIGTFTITWSFFFSTSGIVKWSLSTDPIAGNLTGEFLFKDVVLLCVCIVLFLASLPKAFVPLRTKCACRYSNMSNERRLDWQWRGGIVPHSVFSVAGPLRTMMILLRMTMRQRGGGHDPRALSLSRRVTG
jgi:hypothetical protein